MAINVNEDQINSSTNKIIETFVSDYMHTSKALISAFPGVQRETVLAIEKVRKMILKYFEATPLNYVPVLSFDYGITDEELKIDYNQLFTEEEAEQLIDNHKNVEPTWRDPAYSLPELKGFASLISYKDKEWMEIVRNPMEHQQLLAQKMRAFNNSLVIGMNGLQKNALKHLIKLILNIYKKATQFNSLTEYKRPTYDSEQNRILNRANYGIDHVYLRNQNGTKVGVLFKNIPANTYNTYEEAETAGAIVTLNLIKKVVRPKDGESRLNEQENVDKFIKSMMQLENDFNQDLAGYCLNGSEIGVGQKELRVFLLDNIYPFLAVDAYAGANNIGQLRVNMVDNAIRLHSFFDADELAADDNAEKDVKLGLSHVYGLVGDFSTEQPLACIRIEEKGTYNKVIEDKNHNKFYLKSVVLPRFVISPNQFVTLIVDETFEVVR